MKVVGKYNKANIQARIIAISKISKIDILKKNYFCRKGNKNEFVLWFLKGGIDALATYLIYHGPGMHLSVGVILTILAEIWHKVDWSTSEFRHEN